MVKVAVLQVKLYAPWVHSLKEKRMVAKSLLAKLRNKFQVSAAEVEEQDVRDSGPLQRRPIPGIGCCHTDPFPGGRRCP